jgi:predicted Zn-dependent peptidase
MEWADMVNRVERMEKITKQDVVEFANKYLKDSNFAVVYKRQGQDPNVKKISKPAITPIMTNRDTTSAFLREIQETVVPPIDPVFVDLDKDMGKGFAGKVPMLYAKNNTNQRFSLTYSFDFGTNEVKELGVAADYIEYLGTSDMSASEIMQEFYNLACDYSVRVTQKKLAININGLAENMAKAVALVEKIITDAQPNKEAYDNLVADILKSRNDNKANQSTNFSRLRQYGMYGSVNPAKNILSEEELTNVLKPETLIELIADLWNTEHRIAYYGPMEMDEVSSMIGELHKVGDTLKHIEKNTAFQPQLANENIVYIAPYDANQIYLSSVSNYGEKYNEKLHPIITLYNEYFGGGMNSIVFQEMREARGLAYSAQAFMVEPSRIEDPVYYMTYIATQNDKMIDALTAFDDIINNMPVSEKAFGIAKEAIISRLRTERITPSMILDYYEDMEDLGLTEDSRKNLFEVMQNLTLDDVFAYQQEHVKGRKYITCILGRESDLDMKSLESWGKIVRLTSGDIFGY